MSYRAMQTTRKMFSTRQTRFWRMWDEESIDVTMRDRANGCSIHCAAWG